MAPKKTRRTVTFEPEPDVRRELDAIKDNLGRGAVTTAINNALRGQLHTVLDRAGDALKRLAEERRGRQAAALTEAGPEYVTQPQTISKRKRSHRDDHNVEKR